MKKSKLASELHKIAEKHGGELRPVDVVKAARPVSSPLHSRFEWDDSKAAESHRLWQARQLISITVEFIGQGEQQVSARVFVSLTPDRRESGGYRVTSDVMGNSTQRKQLLDDALQEMERFQNKYSQLKELAEVFAAMRRATVRKSVAA